MTDADRAELGRYIRHVADGMCLRDWTFDLPLDPLPDSSNAYATVETIDGRKRAAIRFCLEFRELKPEDQRHVVVHELVHCHLAMAQDLVERDLERHLGTPVDQLLFRSFRRSLEYGVDGIAEALAPFLPVIDWPHARPQLGQGEPHAPE